MVIHGIDNLTLDDIEREVDAGGRFVFYEYCVSVIVASSRRPSDIFFLRGDDWGIVRGLWYCLLSLLFGWWGIHWGLIYTPLTLFNNLGGGCDVTGEVMNMLQSQAALPDEAPLQPGHDPAGPEGRTPCEEP